MFFVQFGRSYFSTGILQEEKAKVTNKHKNVQLIYDEINASLQNSEMSYYEDYKEVILK